MCACGCHESRRLSNAAQKSEHNEPFERAASRGRTCSTSKRKYCSILRGLLSRLRRPSLSSPECVAMNAADCHFCVNYHNSVSAAETARARNMNFNFLMASRIGNKCCNGFIYWRPIDRIRTNSQIGFMAFVDCVANGSGGRLRNRVKCRKEILGPSGDQLTRLCKFIHRRRANVSLRIAVCRWCSDASCADHYHLELNAPLICSRRSLNRGARRCIALRFGAAKTPTRRWD